MSVNSKVLLFARSCVFLMHGNAAFLSCHALNGEKREFRSRADSKFFLFARFRVRLACANSLLNMFMFKYSSSLFLQSQNFLPRSIVCFPIKSNSWHFNRQDFFIQTALLAPTVINNIFKLHFF